MNKKTLFIAIILACLIGMLTVACEEKNALSSGDRVQDTGENTPEAVPGLVMDGTLEWSDSEGLILVDGQDRHGLKSDSDLSPFIGRQIKVTGTLEADDSGSFIQVVQAVEAHDSQTE